MYTVKLVTALVLAILATIGCATHPGMRYQSGGEPGSSTLDRGLKEMTALIEKTVQDPERFKIKAMLTAQEWKALSEGMALARNRYWHGT